MIFKAIGFAVKAHSGQYRKGTKLPYIVHPLGVAKILIEYGCPEQLIVAGILHDAVEDTHVSLHEIKHLFGWDVADLVEAASEPDKSDTWENRKKHTIGMLQSLSLQTNWITFGPSGRILKEMAKVYGTGSMLPRSSRNGIMKALRAPFLQN